MYAIEVTNEQASLDIAEPLLQDVSRHVLLSEGIAVAVISVAILDDPAMQECNRRYLAHDDPTDVLSFLLESEDALHAAAVPGAPRGAGRRIEGEVLISADTALREAARFGWRPEQELLLYLVHGLLHLCGYDDGTEQERDEMRRRERAILQNWNITPHYEESGGD